MFSFIYGSWLDVMCSWYVVQMLWVWFFSVQRVSPSRCIDKDMNNIAKKKILQRRINVKPRRASCVPSKMAHEIFMAIMGRIIPVRRNSIRMGNGIYCWGSEVISGGRRALSKSGRSGKPVTAMKCRVQDGFRVAVIKSSGRVYAALCNVWGSE